MLVKISTLAPRVVKKKRADMNDGSEILNKLLSRKKAPAKKKYKTTTIVDGKQSHTQKIFICLFVDSKYVILVKQFRQGKKVFINFCFIYILY